MDQHTDQMEQMNQAWNHLFEATNELLESTNHPEMVSGLLLRAAVELTAALLESEDTDEAKAILARLLMRSMEDQEGEHDIPMSTATH